MVISRRLVIGLIGAGAIAVALYAVPLAPALSPDSRNARLDQTLRGLVEGRSTPGIVVLILQDGQPVYRRSVGVREVGSDALIAESEMSPPRLNDEGRHLRGSDDPYRGGQDRA